MENELAYGLETKNSSYDLNTCFKVVGKPSVNYLGIIEGLLYVVGDDGISFEEIRSVLKIDTLKLNQYLAQLVKRYQDPLYGIELVNYGGNYKFLSKHFVAPYAKLLFSETRVNHLSQSALETLAIIAYKQPITRIEIEELRGVSCDVMLRKLCAKNLIKEAGRSQALGRPILYCVTEEFLDTFKLESLKDLPKLSEFDLDKQQTNLFE